MNQPNQPEQPPPPPEKKLGDILRKARETAGLDQNTLSADTKLNINTLQNLETGQYGALPAYPYVKAFLITLCKRLKLEQDEIIQLLNKEMGKEPSEFHIGSKTESIKVTPSPHRKTPILIILSLFIILLFILFTVQEKRPGFFQSNTYKSPAGAQPQVVASPQVTSETSHARAKNPPLPPQIDTSLPEKHEIETLLDPLSDTSAASSQPSTKPKKQPKTKPKPKFTSSLVFTCIKDSVWLSISRTGRRDVNRYLVKDGALKISYHDTVSILAGVKEALLVQAGNESFYPSKKRFKIIKGTLVE